MVWAYILSNAGMMSDPNYYRQIWMAAMSYSDKTIDEVIAQHEADQAERERAAKNRKPGSPAPARVGPSVQPKQSELDKLHAMLARPRGGVNLDDPPAPS